jgi:hypothetical protein
MASGQNVQSPHFVNYAASVRISGNVPALCASTAPEHGRVVLQ